MITRPGRTLRVDVANTPRRATITALVRRNGARCLLTVRHFVDGCPRGREVHADFQQDQSVSMARCGRIGPRLTTLDAALIELDPAAAAVAEPVGKGFIPRLWPSVEPEDRFEASFRGSQSATWSTLEVVVNPDSRTLEGQIESSPFEGDSGAPLYRPMAGELWLVGMLIRGTENGRLVFLHAAPALAGLNVQLEEAV